VNLQTSVQAVIIAGKIGKPVKPVERLQDKSKGSRFEIDEHELKKETLQDQMVDDMHDDSSPIIAPNAKLIRSMRRCEWKLPPILVDWSSVDVVLTNHELVLLSAYDIEDKDVNEDDENGQNLRKREIMWNALNATKGGKGLRLRDVLLGRKIVGHLELSEVDLVRVLRLLPVSTDAFEDTGLSINVGTPMDPQASESKVEYWKSPISGMEESPWLSRRRRWEQVEEDQLKIHTAQGTNYLRFFSDLEEWDAVGNTSQHIDDLDHINKNDAILWCQTIARLCGTEKLKQKLPHFGDKDEKEELRDFIEIQDRESGLRNRLTATRRMTFRVPTSTNALDILGKSMHSES